MEKQFTTARVIGLIVVFGAMIAWITWMVNVVGVEGDVGFEDPSVWDRYRGIAILTVVFVVVVDAAVIVLTLRKGKRDKEVETAAAAERRARLKGHERQATVLATNALEMRLAKSAVKAADGPTATRGSAR